MHFWRRLAEPRASRDPEPVALSCRGEVVHLCRARFAALPRPFLALHPGSGGSPKRWSREGFLRIAERWRERVAEVVVILGPAEAAESEWWRGRGSPTLDDLDLVGLGTLLGECALYLGNDSGVSHLAGTLGAPGVALFGPTDPRLWRPLSRSVSAVRLAPWSSCGEPAAHSHVEAVDRALTAAAVRAGGFARSP
jgi:ADP-heptose:LPS heptosyltransferase